MTWVAHCKIGSGSLFSTSGIAGNLSVLLKNPVVACRAFPPQSAGGFLYNIVIPSHLARTEGLSCKQCLGFWVSLTLLMLFPSVCQ